MDNTTVLPSEKIQKEFERNPLKLLEEIRSDDNSTRDFEEEENQPEMNREPVSNPQESEDINDIYRPNLTCKNSLNDCNFYNNSNDSQNILFNKLNIFLNFKGKEESKNNENGNVNNYVYNSHCQKNNVYINYKNNNSNFEPFCNDNNNSNFLNNSLSYDGLNINFTKNVNNNRHININKLLSNLKTYKGSIHAQSLLEKIDNENELSSFFNDIIPSLCQIMCSEYGNYFFQKLIKKLSLEQRLQIYKIIQPEFLIIATNKWGTHSIQSLMDNAQTQLEKYGLNLLISQNMYVLFTDDNAYHIMMKMILDFPEEQRMVLNLYLVSNIDKIITNNNGAFCVNKFIVNNTNLQLRKLFLENLKNNLKKIIHNKYSCINLLIVLQTFGPDWGAFIITEIKENFIALLDNPVSRLFVIKVFEFLKSKNLLFLKELLWTLFRNAEVVKYIVANKGKKKLLNQLMELSDKEQKVYLYILLKRSNW